MFYTYILFSPTKNSYYIGFTSDALDERLKKHNTNHKGFTGTVADWQVAYFETFPTKELAYTREREIKKWKSKIRIEELIAKSNQKG
jgi:putative endonuclease